MEAHLLQETMLLPIMVFAISALPVLTVPGWFTGIGRVFPVTPAVASLYGVMLGHRGVTGAWGTGGLVWVAVTAAAYLAAGITAVRILEPIEGARCARRLLTPQDRYPVTQHIVTSVGLEPMAAATPRPGSWPAVKSS